MAERTLNPSALDPAKPAPAGPAAALQTPPPAAARRAHGAPAGHTSRRRRPVGFSATDLSLHGLDWCARVYLPACLRLLALDRCAHQLETLSKPTRWLDVPALGLAVWEVAQRWHDAALTLQAPAAAPATGVPACPAICRELGEVKEPALRAARLTLAELHAVEDAEQTLALHWPLATARPSRVLADWTIQRELRAGGPSAATLTVHMIDRLGDELVHAASGMALRLAAASDLTAQVSAQPLTRTLALLSDERLRLLG